MPHLTPEILFEDNHCLAVNKPAGFATTHFQGSHETVDRAVKRYLKAKYQKPGNVFLGVVHRLDKPVSGVLLFARTSKAAARLSEQFREHTVEKVYWATVEGKPDPAEGTLDDWLRRNEVSKRVEVVAETCTNAQHAVTAYRVLETRSGLSWLELRLRTGRKHQLRVQLAARGFPIYGDAKYGSSRRMPTGIALHAHSLTFSHPVQHSSITLTGDVPPSWREIVAWNWNAKS